MAPYLEFAALLVALFVLYLLFQFLKNFLLIIFNSVLGLAVLFILNAAYHVGIAIDIWSVAIVGFGGLPGLLIILVLHYLGLGF
jgi:inhibitor of the pro-sigma K processing machinery